MWVQTTAVELETFQVLSLALVMTGHLKVSSVEGTLIVGGIYRLALVLWEHTVVGAMITPLEDHPKVPKMHLKLAKIGYSITISVHHEAT